MSLDLFGAALLAGVLLGGFYAAVSLGLQVAFGLLDVPHMAHPTFLVVGGYGAWLLNQRGIDPIAAGLLLAPLFFVAGVVIYRLYFATFERRGADTGLRGLTFFFGLAFILEVLLTLAFGADQRTVEAAYIGRSVSLLEVRLPLRMLVAFGVAMAVAAVLVAYLQRSYLGRAIRAVAQDGTGVALVGADPVRVKQWAFGIATATAAIAGALLIMVSPIEPSLGRAYIGKAFSIVVLAGMGSIGGTVLAAMILGIAESVVLTSFGASWAPAVAFTMLLLVLAVRPSGLFGRA
ncbi:MAG: branched-chain amino acid ABC transporter permease [Pseudomonadota bacterium]